MPIFSDRQREMLPLWWTLAIVTLLGSTAFARRGVFLVTAFTVTTGFGVGPVRRTRRPNIALIREMSDSLIVEMRKTLLDSGAS